MSHTQAQLLDSDWTGPMEGCVWDCHMSPGGHQVQWELTALVRCGDQCACSYLISICKNGQEESRQLPQNQGGWSQHMLLGLGDI